MAKHVHARPVRRTPAAQSMKDAAPTDKLERAKAMAREARDLEIEIKNREALLKADQDKLKRIKEQDLVDLFTEVGIDHIGIPPEGNLPAYDCQLEPFTHANISAEWDDDRKNDAFSYLDKNKAGDLIKSTLTVALGRGDYKTMKKVTTALKKLKVPYEIKLAVPWATLTSWVKARVDAGAILEFDKIGAHVGQRVSIDVRKDK